MPESSRPWQFGVGDGLGAAADGSYTADQWDNIFHAAFAQGGDDYGVLRGQDDQLLVEDTAPASDQVVVNLGAAFVHGIFYENTGASFNFPAGGFPAPAALDRYDRVVLRADWALRTVRVHRIAGAEGAGIPALTQNDGVTWDIPLSTCLFTVAGGGIPQAITDDRQFVEPRQREFDAIVGDRPGDYATLTAALADGHRSIFIRSGTYSEPASVTLTSGMWLCGEDANAAILDFGANQLLVNEAAPGYADHVLIENLGFVSTNVDGAVYMRRSRYCVVRRCAWVSSRGLYMTSDCLEHIIADNWFDTITGDTAISANGPATGSSHILRGNRINDGRIYCAPGTSGIAVVENVIIGAGDTAILMGSNYGQVLGNTVTSLASGISITGDNAMVSGNSAIGCGINGIGIIGNYATVTGNACALNTDMGIDVDGGSCTVVGNQARGNTIDGIRFSGTADIGVCKGNICTSNGGAGIYCDADQVIIGDNNCQGNTSFGIDYAGDRDIVLGNIALTNVAGQIDATGATNAEAAHNVIA